MSETRARFQGEGCAVVLAARMETLRAAIATGHIPDIEFQFDRVRRALDKLRAELGAPHHPAPVSASFGEAYQTVHIHTLPDGRATAYVETNDDDDDGQPDGEIASWRTWHPTVGHALAQYGKTRVGVSGICVTVYLNGVQQR